MSSFRPLSKRSTPDPRFDGPQEGLPGYLLNPVMSWVGGVIWIGDALYGAEGNGEVLQSLQVALRLEDPLAWDRGSDSAAQSLVSRMKQTPDFALDVLDYFVQRVVDSPYANGLDQILAEGGSVWEVAEGSEGERFFSRRVVGPVGEAILMVSSDSERTGRHLEAAWQKLLGRNPDPSAAYREAIRAVEASAKPVVTPDDPTATLGKIIRAIRDKPEKWTVVLDKSSSNQIADMCDLIWKGQMDRHGTDDPNAPLNVSQEEADAAVHIAMTLARLFASGGIRRV
jgi:hypothetical protein